jgi:excisionase family DNA binding protein
MGKEVLNLCNASVHYEVTEDILNTFVNDLTNKVTNNIISMLNAEKAQHNLSVNEVCELLNVSKPTLWRWNKVGYLKHTMVGGRRYYKQSEVNVILERKGGKCYE